MDTSDSTRAPAPIQTSAPPPRTSTEVVIEGQEPVPLSPIDRVRTTVEASIDAGLAQASPSQAAADVVSPDQPLINISKTLPLPASSSLLGEEERPFAKPIRSFTNPNIDAATLQPGETPQQQQQQQQQQQPSQGLAPSTTTTTTEDTASMEQQPMIAELPATPLASPDMPSHKSDATKNSPKSKSNKPEDSSVLYNIPVTPSAEAFEIANKNISAGYFDPVFPEDSKAVPPVVEGSRS